MSSRRLQVRLFVLVAAGVTAGAAAGLGSFTFVYAKGASYMTNDPGACANCHVMREQFEGWSRGSHHAVAVCNDCHAPHDFFGKYRTKAINGFNHSLAMTTNRFHEPISISSRNRRITEASCRHCHEEIVQAIEAPHAGLEETSCLRCHSSVGHLR